MVSSQLELHRYATGRVSRVVTTLTLLKSHLFRLSSLSQSHSKVMLSSMSTFSLELTSNLVCHFIEDIKVMLARPLFLVELIVLDRIYTQWVQLFVWSTTKKISNMISLTLSCTGLSTWFNRHTAICHNGFRVPCCNVSFWIKVQRRPHGKCHSILVYAECFFFIFPFLLNT
jgi:hypothetical protein